MTYNEEELSRRIKKRKKEFLIKVTISLFLILAITVMLSLFTENTVIFVSVVTIVLSVVFILRTIKRYQPLVLFSKEVRGENIKEHEFVVTDRRVFRFGKSYLITKRRLRASDFAATRTRTKPPTSAIVYLRLSDGNVTFIDGLTNAQADVYEIGDTLYKYPGVRYPIIVGRDVDAQPCPICGTANKRGEEECINCDLKIEN